jgi:hypothetical protein
VSNLWPLRTREEGPQQRGMLYGSHSAKDTSSQETTAPAPVADGQDKCSAAKLKVRCQELELSTTAGKDSLNERLRTCVPVAEAHQRQEQRQRLGKESPLLRKTQPKRIRKKSRRLSERYVALNHRGQGRFE